MTTINTRDEGKGTMATKSTKYLVGERWKDSHGQGTMFLGYISADGSVWNWAKNRADAARFDSMESAVKAADAWRANILKVGYQPGNTKVMTDPPGPDCSYRPA